MQDYKKAEIEFEDKIAKDYNHWYHNSPIAKFYDQDFVNYVKKNINNGDKVLDLGCAAASLWKFLTKIKGIELVGADVSPKMVNEAKKLFPQGKFVVSDSEKLPFNNEEFDIVICSSVLHHLPSPGQTFKEIRRVLKPYGKLIGREPQDDQFVKETDPWIAGAISSLMHLIMRKQRITDIKEPKIHEHHHAYKIKEFVVKDLSSFFVVKDIISKYPFSSLFNKIDKHFHGWIITKTDDFFEYYKGNQFFYLAIKDGYGKTEVLSYINIYLKKLEVTSKKPPLKFIKRLIWLTAIFDLILPKK